jgi:hypothetical protein
MKTILTLAGQWSVLRLSTQRHIKATKKTPLIISDWKSILSTEQAGIPTYFQHLVA